jgi:Uma2 family endonuclease
MSTLAEKRMTVDEFLAWAEGLEGRWELLNGVPYRMPAERTGHTKAKYRIHKALERAVEKAGAPCHVLGDGPGVRITQYVLREPDALVYCGPEVPDDALEVSNPVVVVEVTSPSTRKVDDTVKRDDYFSLPSVLHCLIVDPAGPPVIHYSRQADGRITRSVVNTGPLTLSPPGIAVEVSEMLAGAT